MKNIFKSKYLIILVAIIIFSPLLLSVNIVPSPYYQYEINGQISRDEPKLNDFTITVYGKTKESNDLIPLFNNGSEYIEKPDLTIAITDIDGHFQLIFSSKYGELEAYSLKVVMPLGESYFTPLIYTKDYTKQELKQKYTYSNESGCSCQSTTSSEMITSGYLLTSNIGQIKLPF